MQRLVGVGGPSLLGSSDGSWDLGPILLAIVALVVIRWALGVRLRWFVVLATFLIAPLAVAISGWVGPAPTLGACGAGMFIARRLLTRGQPERNV